MGKWLKRVAVIVSTLILVLLIGCSAVMDGITPAYIEKTAAEYAGVEDITEFLPYTTLWDLRKLIRKLDYTHQAKQIMIARLLEDDTIQYDFLKDSTTLSLQGALQFQDTFFNPSGPIGMLFPALTAGTLGALLIRRPGDKTKEEYDTAVNGNKTV